MSMYGQDHGGYYQPQYKPFKQRGGCLTIWLVLITIGAVSSIIQGLTVDLDEMQLLQELLLDIPDWYYSVSVVLSVAYLGCAIGLWLWKQWGLFGILLLALIQVFMTTTIGFPILIAIIACAINPIITWLVVNSQWDDFE